jgi:thymidylate synthase
MEMIRSECVDEALFRGLTLLTNRGERQSSRDGDVLVMPHPVMTANLQPMNRVSFNPKRNANPFFHLMEALWMLAGRNDSEFLDQFVGDFGKRYAEEDGHLHGAYGFRWRKHFEAEGGGDSVDQLETVIRRLKANPLDRRVVIAMWDPLADLDANKKDLPCNTHIYPRVRVAKEHHSSNLIGGDYKHHPAGPVLDLTVCCRSNDAVMGCHGANAVHFSVLQEYLAARIGVGVGIMYQLSNNYHVYQRDLDRVWPMGMSGTEYRSGPTMIVTRPDEFDRDLERFFKTAWGDGGAYANEFFSTVAVPLRVAYQEWRAGYRDGGRELVRSMVYSDWKVAAQEWFYRRALKAQGIV